MRASGSSLCWHDVAFSRAPEKHRSSFFLSCGYVSSCSLLANEATVGMFVSLVNESHSSASSARLLLALLPKLLPSILLLFQISSFFFPPPFFRTRDNNCETSETRGSAAKAQFQKPCDVVFVSLTWLPSRTTTTCRRIRGLVPAKETAAKGSSSGRTLGAHYVGVGAKLETAVLRSILLHSSFSFFFFFLSLKNWGKCLYFWTQGRRRCGFLQSLMSQSSRTLFGLLFDAATTVIRPLVSRDVYLRVSDS